MGPPWRSGAQPRGGRFGILRLESLPLLLMPHSGHNQVDRARERAFVDAVLRDEAAAITGLVSRLGDTFHSAVDLLERCANAGGTVLVTGLGKSGLIGAKISATLSSLGIPSHAVHPS